MNNFHIRPIPLYRGIRDRSQWTYRVGYGEKVTTVNYIWYIEGAKEGIIVDCGVKGELLKKRGIPDEKVQSLEEGLNKIGVASEDITVAILTHLHWDHVALASKFSNALFFVQKDEFEFASNPHPAVAAAYDKTLFSGLNLELLEGNKEIIEGIRVFLTPGHTPGGQSVAIDTPEGLAVITGFCCTLENFFPPSEVKAKGIEIVAPGIHTDLLKAYDSVLEVKRMAQIIIPLHEPKFLGMDRIP